MFKSLFGSRRYRVLAGCMAAFVAFSAFSASAFAAAQDYGDLTDGFSAELGAALPVALAAVGLFVGVVMAYKVVRRILGT